VHLLKATLILSITLLISAGCSDNNSGTDSSNQSDYFPLKLGNNWTFISGSDTLIIGVWESKVIDNTTTYTLGPDSPDAYPGYHTSDGPVVYLYGYETVNGDDYILSSPAVFLDSEAGVGETWQVENWGSVEMNERDLIINAPIDTFQNCLHFKLIQDLGGGSIDILHLWTKEGIGIVQFQDNDGVLWNLIGYELH